jgi:hypothetical protein
MTQFRMERIKGETFGEGFPCFFRTALPVKRETVFQIIAGGGLSVGDYFLDCRQVAAVCFHNQSSVRRKYQNTYFSDSIFLTAFFLTAFF